MFTKFPLNVIFDVPVVLFLQKTFTKNFIKYKLIILMSVKFRKIYWSC